MLPIILVWLAILPVKSSAIKPLVLKGISGPPFTLYEIKIESFGSSVPFSKRLALKLTPDVNAAIFICCDVQVCCALLAPVISNRLLFTAAVVGMVAPAFVVQAVVPLSTVVPLASGKSSSQITLGPGI